MGGHHFAQAAAQAVARDGGTKGSAKGIGHMGMGKSRVDKHGAPQGAGPYERAVAPQAGEHGAFVNTADQAERR